MIDLSTYDIPAIDAAWFVRPNGFQAARTIHGIGHTQRVWIHAMEIAAALDFSGWQREALSHAAIWHDIGRTNDHADYYHGAKSAGRVVGLGLHEGLRPIVRDTALFAVTHHSGSEEHAERAIAWLAEPQPCADVFRALKDADGLDRVRLGDLDPSYLRFDVSHERIPLAWGLLDATEAQSNPSPHGFGPGE